MILSHFWLPKWCWHCVLHACPLCIPEKFGNGGSPKSSCGQIRCLAGGLFSWIWLLQAQDSQFLKPRTWRCSNSIGVCHGVQALSVAQFWCCPGLLNLLPSKSRFSTFCNVEIHWFMWMHFCIAGGHCLQGLGVAKWCPIQILQCETPWFLDRKLACVWFAGWCVLVGVLFLCVFEKGLDFFLKPFFWKIFFQLVWGGTLLNLHLSWRGGAL